MMEKSIFGKKFPSLSLPSNFLPIIFMEKVFSFLTKFQLMFYNYVLVNLVLLAFSKDYV